MLDKNAKILVIGCVSLDLIHLEQSDQRVSTVGGAALYTALAAAAAGAQVTLLAPRPAAWEIPHSIAAFGSWIGPPASLEEFPKLEIIHHGGDRATLLGASWGAESQLSPRYLPTDLETYDIVHISALSSAKKQLQFFREIKAKSNSRISAGTYARIAYGETESVRELFADCDYVFMNENESKAVFDSVNYPLVAKSGQIICITRGRNGALVYAGDALLELPAMEVEELDPTGAGDTFAGTFLAAVAGGIDLERSSRLAIERSALVITEGGPSAISRLLC